MGDNCNNGEIIDEECVCKITSDGKITSYYPELGCMPLCDDVNTDEGVNCCNPDSYKKDGENAKKCKTPSQVQMAEKTEQLNLLGDQLKVLQDPKIMNYFAEEIKKTQEAKCDYSDIQRDFQNQLNIYKDATSSDDYAETQNNIINMQSLINTYENLYNKQFNRIKELSNTRKDQNNELKKKVDNNKKIINTNKRKVVYESRELEWINTYKYILLVVFYGLLVAYLVFGNFFSSGLYKNRFILVTLIILSVFPIINIYVIRLIYFIIKKTKYFLNNEAPKNVYIDL